jgi:hypothetical protein
MCFRYTEYRDMIGQVDTGGDINEKITVREDFLVLV